jgi:hypothetical protein
VDAGVGKLEDKVYIQGLNDWPIIKKKEKVVCLNCFWSIHDIATFEYQLATVISKSPIKPIEKEELEGECI